MSDISPPSAAQKHNVVAKTRQAPPLDLADGADDSWLEGKTILITGGASGCEYLKASRPFAPRLIIRVGAGFVRRWAKAGAIVVFGDVNVEKGMKVASEVRAETGNQNVHFVRCDVTKWEEQVRMFKKTLELSPHGGIDAVVANAGIADKQLDFEAPKDLDVDSPAPPRMAVMNVNLTGVLYTTHLALFHLPRNPSSVPARPDCSKDSTTRDRHLLIVGSMASLAGVPGQALYGASKHAVLGLFRSLRATSFAHGVRVSFVAPYFVDTPMLGAAGRALLAGGPLGKPEDVVEAATRFVANPRIVGRALCVGPKLRVEKGEDGLWVLAEKAEAGERKALWEFYAHDFEDVDLFTRNMIGLLNRAVELKGWLGWAKDMFRALLYPVWSR